MALSDVKEDVYEALDEWAAFELEFPVVATRMALEKLRKQEQWHRIIQITKWMFNKGLGKTHGSYLLLLKAYCMEGRLTEAEDLWNGLLVSQNRSMPKSLFAFMTNVYRRHGMPEKVTQVFEQMEGFGIKPDIDILRRAEEAYQQLNMKDEVEQLGKKYSKNSRTRRKEKRLKERKENLTLEHGKVSNGKEQEFDGVYQTDEDEEDAQRHVIEASSDTSNKSSGIEEPVGLKRSQKGRRPEHVLTVVESEFLKQVLDTMR
ncbi:hypothetical protein KP509_34G044800 [Ceratopteris richardii]|nr:hypothetical protein KP509_34G044800 [Ceratopteris richardii]